jgi:hypothetical protein
LVLRKGDGLVNHVVDGGQVTTYGSNVLVKERVQILAQSTLWHQSIRNSPRRQQLAIYITTPGSCRRQLLCLTSSFSLGTLIGHSLFSLDTLTLSRCSLLLLLTKNFSSDCLLTLTLRRLLFS